MSTLVRGAVMVWSAGMLTAHYFGVVKNLDATFIAGLFTSTLASFGVTTVGKSEDDQKKKAAIQAAPQAKPKSKPPGPPPVVAPTP